MSLETYVAEIDVEHASGCCLADDPDAIASFVKRGHCPSCLGDASIEEVDRVA